MQLQVNGESREVAADISISEFLAWHNLNAMVVVVEHNRVIVPRDRYADVVLRPGDDLEIVQMMAGG